MYIFQQFFLHCRTVQCNSHLILIITAIITVKIRHYYLISDSTHGRWRGRGAVSSLSRSTALFPEALQEFKTRKKCCSRRKRGVCEGGQEERKGEETMVRGPLLSLYIYLQDKSSGPFLGLSFLFVCVCMFRLCLSIRLPG